MSTAPTRPVPSVSAAIYLSVAFGPLGLFYVGAPVAMIAVASTVALTAFWTGGFGAFVAWGFAIIASVVFALRARVPSRPDAVHFHSAPAASPIAVARPKPRSDRPLHRADPTLTKALAAADAAVQTLSAPNAAVRSKRPKRSRSERVPLPKRAAAVAKVEARSPASSGRSSKPRLPGWYFDPDDESKLRWWDGENWTNTIMGQ